MVVTGRNFSVPQFELALLDRANNNWTVGPYLVTYNRSDIIPIISQFYLVVHSQHLLRTLPSFF